MRMLEILATKQWGIFYFSLWNRGVLVIKYMRKWLNWMQDNNVLMPRSVSSVFFPQWGKGPLPTQLGNYGVVKSWIGKKISHKISEIGIFHKSCKFALGVLFSFTKHHKVWFLNKKAFSDVTVIPELSYCQIQWLPLYGKIISIGSKKKFHWGCN